MYVVRRARNPEGLGFAPFIVPLIVAIAGSAGGAVATRLISGPSKPSQKEIEEQIKLQHELEIQRMIEARQLQQQQVQQVGSLLMPALGIMALVALLR